MRQAKRTLAVLAYCLAGCDAATAQTAGTVMIKGGYDWFYPQVRSGDISGAPGAKIDVRKAGHAFGSIAYMLTDHVATEFTLGAAPHHAIYGAGTIAAAGKIASADIVPPALSVQYRFSEAQSPFRTFLGIGIVRAMFRNIRTEPIFAAIAGPDGASATVSIDPTWGVASQVGFSYVFDNRWFIDGTVIPMFIKTTARISTGQTVDATINPVGVNLSIGYRF